MGEGRVSMNKGDRKGVNRLEKGGLEGGGLE